MIPPSAPVASSDAAAYPSSPTPEAKPAAPEPKPEAKPTPETKPAVETKPAPETKPAIDAKSAPETAPKQTRNASEVTPQKDTGGTASAARQTSASEVHPASLELVVFSQVSTTASFRVALSRTKSVRLTAGTPVQLTAQAGHYVVTLSIPAGAFGKRVAREVKLGELDLAGERPMSWVINLDEAGELLSVADVSREVPPAADIPVSTPNVAALPAPGDTTPTASVAPTPDPEAPTSPEPPSPATPSTERGPGSVSVTGVGTLRGTVVAGEDRHPVVGAAIFVLGTQTGAETNEHGEFTLRLPAGDQSVSVVHDDFPTETVVDVRIRANQISDVRLELRLVPGQNPDEVVVSARVITGGVATLLNKRRESASVTDALGSAEMAKAPDGSASAATRRIVGASIVGGQFLFVRGLGGRYANTRLNGAPLANTDPDLPGFQLDLFPTSLLAGLTVSKTFTPDIPADFTGGSLNIETKTYPDKFSVKASIGATVDSETTGRKLWTYDGGSTDFLGYDDGTRALPSGFPAKVVKRKPTNPDLSSDDVDAIGGTFKNNWKRSQFTALPSPSLGLSIGDRFQLGQHRLGYMATLGYRRKFERNIEIVQNISGSNAGLFVNERLVKDSGKVDSQIGGLATLTYEYGENQRITGLGLITQTGTDSASVTTGRSDSAGQLQDRTQFSWIERQLRLGQLIGEHKKVLDLGDLRWQLNLAQTARDQPDTRDMRYLQNNEGNWEAQGPTGSAEHLYSTLDQTDVGGALDTTIPIKQYAVAKAGYLMQSSKRNFDVRRFGHYDISGLTDAPEDIFQPQNSGVVWSFQESTAPSDAYSTKQQLHAAYALAEFSAIPRLRLTAGARLESYHQRIHIGSEHLIRRTADYRTQRRLDFDILPAASAVFKLSEVMFLRAAYGNTVARPLGRELASVVSYDYIRNRTISGNPDLTRTLVHNYDLRWELFPTPTEVFAVSVFYKMFRHPIEATVADPNGNISFANVDGAQNYGAEIEARAGLGLLTQALSNFSVVGNLAIIRSRVELSAAQLLNATNPDRALAGQSPYVGNIGLTFEPPETGFTTSLYYNVFGPRIDEVGIEGLPDTFEQPFHSLDYTAAYDFRGFTLGLSATNLLHQQARVTADQITTSRIQKGTNLGLSLAWKN